MGQKDITEKVLEDYNDVFADIINGLLFDGVQEIKPEALENTTVHAQYKAEDGKVHELERDIAKYWKEEKVELALVCVGDEGGMKEIVLEKFKKLKVMDSLRLLGIREDVAQIMQMFDVFVLPSRWEGLGIVYIEAQAAGVQTFASDVVPKEAKVTELLHYISLKKSPEVWAREILKYENGYVKRDTTEEIKKKGYNIQTITKRLEDIYLNNKN